MEHFLRNYYVLQTMEDLFLLPHFFPCASMRQSSQFHVKDDETKVWMLSTLSNVKHCQY